MTNKTPCKFCRYIEQEYADCNALNASDDYYFVIRAEPERTRGHMLVISKEHYSDITKLPISSIHGFFKGVHKWAEHIIDVYHPIKVYIVSMCEHFTDEELAAWGVEEITEHLHFHLIPRYASDPRRGNAFLTGE